MKKLKLIILTFLLCIFISTTTYAANTLEETYSLNTINQYTNVFKNYVDGYSIMVPKSAKLYFDPDQNMTRFDYGNKKLKIFMETFNKGFNKADYEVYSAKGIYNNTVDHNITFDSNIKLANGNVRVIEFNRRKLKKIKNDKNYYLICFKNIDDMRTMTLMLKSETPIDRNDFLKMVGSVNTNVPVTKTPYLSKAKNRYFDNAGNAIKEKNWSDETKEVYLNDFVKSQKQTWGIYSDGFWMYNQIPGLESEANIKFKYMILYHNLNESNANVRAALHYAKNNNKVVELTFQTHIRKGNNLIYDVLDGQYDNYFKEMAKMIKEEKTPTIFRIANEMNGDWCSYSAWNTGLDSDIYHELYNYLYDIMQEQGANPYLMYVFNPNGGSFPNFKYNQESVYRPNDHRFDIMGLTLYNTGTYYKDEKWSTFDELYYPLYVNTEKRYDKPFMITEFSCSSLGGDKVKWTSDMLNSIKNYGKIKVAIWFNGIDRDANGNPARIYKIDDPKENIKVFRDYFTKNNSNSNAKSNSNTKSDENSDNKSDNN